MKKMMMILALMVAMATSAAAMSYQEAKSQALFLADKMAYELNLTDEQYEAAYEINLDYLMAVNNQKHLFGSYWTRRNTLFNTILAPWQYSAYSRADYFYRPVYWSNNTWRWRIYNRYGRSRYYRSHPAAYISYRGGRSVTYYKNRNWRRPEPPRNGRHDDVYMRQDNRRPGMDRNRPNMGRDQRRPGYDRYDRRGDRRYDNNDYKHRDKEYRDMKKENKEREKDFRNMKKDNDKRMKEFYKDQKKHGQHDNGNHYGQRK